MLFRKCGEASLSETPMISIQDAKGGASNAIVPEDFKKNIFDLHISSMITLCRLRPREKIDGVAMRIRSRELILNTKLS
jgi:hypothetical protein